MTTLDKTHGTQRPQNPIANHFILYYKHNLISLLQQLKLNSSFKIKKKLNLKVFEPEKSQGKRMFTQIDQQSDMTTPR